jgi:hypothetical protein
MDTQIGLLGEKYSLLALDDGSAFNSYNLMLTNLLLYLTLLFHMISPFTWTLLSVRLPD